MGAGIESALKTNYIKRLLIYVLAGRWWLDNEIVIFEF